MDEPDGYARHGDIQLAYWERGSGQRVVLLIMGVMYRSAFWRERVIDALSREHRVVWFDNRGTGYSTKPVEHLTAELWAGDALAVLDTLGIQRATVIGYSMGGRIAQQLMIDHPDRLERVVLLSAAVGGKQGVPPTQEALSAFTPAAGQDPRTARREGTLMLCGPGFAQRDPAAVEEFLTLGDRKKTPVSVLLKQLTIATTSVCDQLASATMPCLIVQGDADPLVRPGNADLLKQKLPQAEQVTLRGCGHLPQWEAPDALLDAILPFLRASD